MVLTVTQQIFSIKIIELNVEKLFPNLPNYFLGTRNTLF